MPSVPFSRVGDLASVPHPMPVLYRIVAIPLSTSTRAWEDVQFT